MIDAPTHSRLQDLFRRENRSLLQYAREASPWSADKDRAALGRVQEIAEAEFRALEDLADFLEDQHVPLPYLGAYPMRFTDFNFIGVRSLLPKLVEDQRRHAAALEQDVEAVNGKVREAVKRLLELKRKHLAELEQL